MTRATTRIAAAAAAIAAVVAVAAPTPARAHSKTPCLLELTEMPSGDVEADWKVPVNAGRKLAVSPVFPDDCRVLVRAPAIALPDAAVDRWVLACDGLAGKQIAVRGLDRTGTDALVVAHLADGRDATALLTRDRPSAVIAGSDASAVSTGFVGLGIDHILGGADHLLFVLGLVLLVRGRWRVARAITAFTLGHSVTLTLATLGVVRFPTAAVEAVIALSIVFLAVELTRAPPRDTLLSRRPWLIAFAFGLLHGFGFAGALAEVGLPAGRIPTALLSFNLGVELGQLAFVAACLAARALLLRARITRHPWARLAPAYAMGAVATLWCAQRVAVF